VGNPAVTFDLIAGAFDHRSLHGGSRITASIG